jgi:hypothetical protein
MEASPLKIIRASARVQHRAGQPRSRCRVVLWRWGMSRVGFGHGPCTTHRHQKHAAACKRATCSSCRFPAHVSDVRVAGAQLILCSARPKQLARPLCDLETAPAPRCLFNTAARPLYSLFFLLSHPRISIQPSVQPRTARLLPHPYPPTNFLAT